MRRAICLALVSAVMTSAAAAAPPKPPPPPPVTGLYTTFTQTMPEIQLVETVAPDAGTFTTVKQVTKYAMYPQQVIEKVPYQIQEQVIVNGVPTTVTKTAYKEVVKTVAPVPQQLHKISKLWSVSSDTITDSAGKHLSKEEVFKRLQPGTAVLVLPIGQNLNPAWQQLLNKNAVLLMPGAGAK
jgi:hypothetical protein